MAPSRSRPAALASVVAACLVLLAWLPASSLAVKRQDFKTCAQSGFCRRNRARADRAVARGSAWTSPYSVRGQPTFDRGTLSASLGNALFPDIGFSLDVAFATDGTARIRVDEKNGLRQRYNEAARWTLISDPVLDADVTVEHGKGETRVTYGKAKENVFLLEHLPIKVTFFREGQPHIVLNERGLFNMEHFRLKSVGEAVQVQDGDATAEQKVNVKVEDEAYEGFADENEDGMWEENFGGRQDTKPKGPESLSLDITFPGYSHVFGIPQHASPFSLKPTRGSDSTPTSEAYRDPYRLFNTDVFEYEHDSEMSIYGSIPYLQAQRPGSAVAVFWLNAAETWIDVEKESTTKGVTDLWKKLGGKKSTGKASGKDKGPGATSTTTHWISETGILDLFVFLGPTPTDLFASFGSLVGTTTLPPYFAIAYHQCRWNYVSQEDVAEVVQKFDEHDIPLDVMWLDIEWAEEHKYFIWDRKVFPEPEKMVAGLEATGRKLVTIIDPHIKRSQSLYVYKEAQDLGVLCKQPDGKTEYEGWCWTGSSSWVDYFDPKSWAWWAGLFKLDKFQGSTINVHNWLDMNEPAIFNAPEITMPRDNIHYGGWEHRDVHNLNGLLTHNASHRGLRERTDPPMRGFVLSRSFYAGTQRYGAIWQGDNLGTWEHLAVSIPMLLSNGLAGMAFQGADVGGFFGNPTTDMLVRWYQAGSFMPFFRAHAHIDTKRREPYLFEAHILKSIRDSLRLRYSLLPTWYTAFFENSITGAPIVKPQSVVFPDDEQGYAVDDQFYVGSSGLLVKPITHRDTYETEIYLDDAEPYYNYFTHDVFFGTSAGSTRVKFPAPLETLPLFLRGGHIVTRRDLIRRAAPLMWRDPITLVVGTSLESRASGTLYLDDGESEQYKTGSFIYRGFELRRTSPTAFTLASKDLVPSTKGTNALTSSLNLYSPSNSWARKIEPIKIGQIVVLGLSAKPVCVKVSGQAKGLDFDWSAGVASTGNRRKAGLDQTASVLTIKSAAVRVVDDWSISIHTEGSACAVTPAVDPLSRLQSPDCAAGYYRCPNAGHVSSCLLISRVNDGICDPECCDGSDETDGKVHCPNRCKEVGDAHRKTIEAESRKYRVGGKERQNYIAFGRREQKKLEETVAKLEVEIVVLKDKERSAKATLEQVEATDAADIAKKKASVLYVRIGEHQRAIKMLRKQREDLENDLRQLTSILTDLKNGYNPNYQDMAVKGAVKGFEEWEGVVVSETVSTDGSEGADSTADPPTEVPDASQHQAQGRAERADDGEFSDDDLTKLEDEDPLVLMQSLEPDATVEKAAAESASLLFKIEEYLPEGLKPTFESFRTKLLDFLGLVGILPGGSQSASPSSSSGDRPDIAKARTAHQDAERVTRETEGKLSEAKAGLEKNWGREWEFKKLDKQCFEKEAGDYTYEVCLFDQAYQKSSNGMRTNLGHFSSWAADADPSSDEYYLKQTYDRGARCWNGPERSVKLDLSCGTQNALLSIMEPEKCEYHFKMTTPAVCFPSKDPSRQAAGGAEGVKKEEL